MVPDPETAANIIQRAVNVLAQNFDYVSYDEGGAILLVEEGFWFELTPKIIDNGEPA